MKTSNPKNSQIAFRIDTGLYMQVKKVCKERGISITDFMTNAIRERLNENIIDALKRNEKRNETE
jgi:hypothetical protein